MDLQKHQPPRRIRRSLSSLTEAFGRVGAIDVKSKFAAGFGTRIVSTPPAVLAQLPPASPDAARASAHRARMHSVDVRSRPPPRGYDGVPSPPPSITSSSGSSQRERHSSESAAQRRVAGDRTLPPPLPMHVRNASAPHDLKTSWTFPLGVIPEMEGSAVPRTGPARAYALPESPISPECRTAPPDSYRLFPPAPPDSYRLFPPAPNRQPPSPPISPSTPCGSVGDRKSVV